MITIDIITIRLDNCRAYQLDFGIFTNATRLRQLDLVHCSIDTLTTSPSTTIYRQLESISLRDNRLSNWTMITETMNTIAPHLRYLDVSVNALTSIDDRLPTSILSLNVSANRIVELYRIPSSIDILDVSLNWIQNLDHVRWPTRITRLNLSHNDVERVDETSFGKNSKIEELDMSFNPIESTTFATLSRLRQLTLTHTRIRYFNLSSLSVRSMQRVNISHNAQLITLIGTLPSYVSQFDVSNCALTSVPNRMFDRHVPTLVRMDENSWNCHHCLIRNIPSHLIQSCNQSIDNEDDRCDIGIARSNDTIVLVEFTRDAVLICDAYGEPTPDIQWYLDSPRLHIGSYSSTTGELINEAHNNSYQVLPGGALLIVDADRSQVGKYRCLIKNIHGERESIIYLRLDLSSWYRLDPFNSIFFGSIMCAFATCVAAFLLNIIWLTLRKMILWWINRAERISRVSKMVEAIERYRQRQMLNLHDTYNRRINHVRDHYHQQVEQLRTSYSSQAERFRDYRAAQMESMTQHIDSIRDNYNQQMGRMREFGSRRADQLWESYERQLNRIRTFSLQQRLRIMRQYKIKQRYLNKLLESVNIEQYQMESLTRQDSKAATAAILAALDAVLMPDEPMMMDGATVSAASSYYSLAPDDDNATDNEIRVMERELSDTNATTIHSQTTIV